VPTDKIYLHAHPEFRELIQIVADQKSIDPVLVEKDYWIMHCLYGLNQLELTYELKGGTSLSKGFRVINRFSEDLDIRIDPVGAPFEVFSGRNHDKERHIQSRKDFYDWLAIDKLKIDGIAGINRDTEFDDEKYRSGGIRLIYQSKFESLEGVRTGILLEVGFDTTTPNEAIDISSWALEHAQKAKVDIINNIATGVKCYAPEYTFVEKLQTVSTKFRQQQEKGTDPGYFMRHYYDLAQLLELERVLNFIKTEEYQNYKKERFRSGDELTISKNEAFILSDKNTKGLYKKAYENAPALYYKIKISFEEIMEKIYLHINKL
jgi:Domain of unknown function (DUF1814).